MRQSLTSCVLLLGLLLIAVGPGTASDSGKMPITTSSSDAKDLYIQGRDLVEKLQPRESRDYFKRAIELDPGFAAAHLQLAQAQPSAALFRESLNRAKSLMDGVSKPEQLWIRGVEAGAVSGDPMLQQKLYRQLIELCPRDERAFMLLGTNQFILQQWDDAIQSLAKATELNPSFSPAYNMLGYAYRTLEQYDRAEDAFKKYVQLIPDDPNPYDSYAELLMKVGRYDESIDMYRKALDVDPDFQASYNGIACNLIFQGDYDGARAALDDMYAHAGDDGQRRNAMLSMAYMYLDKGDFDRCIRILNERLNMSTQAHDTAAMATDHILIAFAVIEVPGRGEEALAEFQKANQIVQESSLSDQAKSIAQVNYQYNAGRAWWAMGDLDKARASLAEYRAMAEKRQNLLLIWNVHHLAGMIALSEKDFDRAVDELAQSNMQNPYHLFYLAKAYEGNGDTGKARDCYRRVAEFNGLNNGVQASVRLKALASLKNL